MKLQQDTYNGKENIKDEKPLGTTGPKEERRPRSKAAKAAQNVITGDFMGERRFRKWYPLAFYCIVLVFLYIGHNFTFQKLQRLEIRQRMELNDERSRSMVFSSMRMNASRHSRIVEEIRRRGLRLEESTTPPKIVK